MVNEDKARYVALGLALMLTISEIQGLAGVEDEAARTEGVEKALRGFERFLGISGYEIVKTAAGTA